MPFLLIWVVRITLKKRNGNSPRLNTREPLHIPALRFEFLTITSYNWKFSKLTDNQNNAAVVKR